MFKKPGRKLVLLLCLILLIAVSIGTTVAYIVTRTDSVTNTFVSGLDPEGDLVIRKTVSHPYGDDYLIPEDIEFTFTVDLGVGYANETFGDLTADENGVITVTLIPGAELEIKDLKVGTEVTVTELQTEGDGFTIEEAEQTVTIQRRKISELTFVNNYEPAAKTLAISGVKTLADENGEELTWQENDGYSFRLEMWRAGEWVEIDTAFVVYDPEIRKDETTGEEYLWVDPDYNRFSFDSDALTFTTVGEWSFRVCEYVPEGEEPVADVVYDDAYRAFDVKVTDDDMDGELELAFSGVTAEDDSLTFAFKNVYDPELPLTAEVLIEIQKELVDGNGQPLTPSGFTFELLDEDGEVVRATEPTLNPGTAKIVLTYTEDQVGEMYFYTLRETNAGRTVNGMTYDDEEIGLCVAVVENEDGTIAAKVFEYDASANAAKTETAEVIDAPNNSEAPVVTAEPVSTEEPAAGDEFSAAVDLIEAVGGLNPLLNAAPESEEDAVVAVSAGESADVLMAEAPTGLEDVMAAAEDSVTQEEAPVVTAEPEIVVTPEPTEEPAEDGEDPVPTAEPEADDAETAAPVETPAAVEETPVTTEAPVVNAEPETENKPEIPANAADTFAAAFKNVYDPADASLTITGEKTLEGREMEEGEFRFLLYATGADFVIPEGAEPWTAVNDENGRFAFAEFIYETECVKYFVVMEDSSEARGGIAYDDTVYHVTVVVTDNNGTLEAEQTVTTAAGEPAELAFVNVYDAGSVDVPLTGWKKLLGASLTAGQFHFELYEADSAYEALGEPVETAGNGADGAFSFETRSYTAPTEEYYLILEDDADPLANITYDDGAYGVKIVVTDDGEGSLTAERTIVKLGAEEAQSIEFVNEFIPEPGTASLEVKVRKTVKNLGEESIGPEGFRFVLAETRADGTVQTYEQVSDEEGNASFILNFAAADAGQSVFYELSEYNDGRKDVIYDETTYAFEVTVSLDEEGNASAAVTMNGETVDSVEVEFVNEYGEIVTTPAPTATPIPSDMPRTGDDSPIMLYVVIMIVLAAALVVVLVSGRRKRRK